MRKLPVLLLLAPFALLAQVPDYVPTDGLVAWYPLDGNATDGSANNQDGVPVNATPAPNRTGIEDMAYSFSETSRIQLPNVSVAGDLSVSFWFKAENGSDGSDAILSSSARFFRLVDISPDEWLIGYNAICPGGGNPTGTGIFGLNEWHHGACTYDGDSLRFYLDGIPGGTQALCQENWFFNDIGYSVDGNHGFEGLIDDVGIWNRVLTASEIETLFDSTTGQEEENLALEFSGISDYLGPNAGILEIPFADALDRTGSDPFTIASDVLFDADGFPYALFHTGQDGDPENSIRFNISTSELEFMWENTGTNYKLECALPATTVGILDTGVWHNIAATWDGVTLTLFVNSIEVASEAPGNGGPGETEDRPFYWGSHLGGNELDGQLDNTQFWTIGLTQEDIQSHLDCPPTGSEPGLEAYWTFNGPDSDLILDITGNGHHGTAQGVQKVSSTRPACSEGNDDEGSIELLIVGATGDETATREALEAYQLDAALTDRDLSITEVDFQDSISPCGQWDALLENKDAALFLGTANLDNCSWEDIIPALDSFMRAGGEVYLQAENSYSMVTRFDGNGSSWPEYWHDHMTEAEAANWFGTAFTAEQPWCCGMGSINLNCTNNTEVLGIEHHCNPLFLEAYVSPENCISGFQEPWLYDVADGDLNSDDFFSVFHFGGDPDADSPANALIGNQMVFGRQLGEGHLIIFGENRPGFAFNASRNLLGNLIHGLSHPEGLSDLIVPTTDCAPPPAILGCTDAAACNYDPTATQEDGSCAFSPVITLPTDTSTLESALLLDAGSDFGAYVWNTGETGETITVTESGQYSVQVMQNGSVNRSIHFDANSTEQADFSAVTSAFGNEGTIAIDFKIETPETATPDLGGTWSLPSYPLFFLDNGAQDPLVIRIGRGCYANAASITLEDDDCGQSNPHVRASWGTDPLHFFDGQWHQIVLSSGAEGHALYVDGTLLSLDYSLGEQSINVWPGDANTFLIARELNADWDFVGELDNLMVWTSPLTSDQASSLDPCQVSPTSPDLLGFWPFDEGDSAVALDVSGNDHHGILGASRTLQPAQTACSPCFAESTVMVQLLIANCTDSLACNYDPAATGDDGSCVFPPSVNLGPDTITCEDIIILDAGDGFASYLWSTGETTQSIEAYLSGEYSVTVEGAANSINAFAMEFDGDDDLIQTGIAAAELIGLDALTIATRFKWMGDDPDGGPQEQGILSNAKSGNSQLDFGIDYEWPGGDRRMHLAWADASTLGSNAMQYSLLDAIAIEPDVWYDVVVTLSSDTVKWYLDGVLVEQDAVVFAELGQESNAVPNLRIGKANEIYDTHFGGVLDDLQLYTRALTAEEAQGLFACSSTHDATGLIGHWSFEEGVGNITLDDSPAGNNGDIVGAEFTSDTPDSPCPGCLASDTLEVSLHHGGCFCGEGTEWDEDSQQCIAVVSGSTPSCGEGTVWDPVAEECIVAIPTDTDFDGCVTAGDVLNLLATFGTCPPIPFSGPCQGLDHMTYQGHDYAIVAIGDQCWFAENLRSAFFRNGEAIPAGLDTESWTQATTPAMTHYAADDSVAYGSEDATGNQLQYGNFYNGYAVQDSRGLCPSGWTVPTDAQWMELESYLGMDSIALNGTQYRPGVGHQISNSPSDTPPWSGNNLTGWSGTPGGARSGNYGYYFEESLVGYFWGRDDNWSGGSLPYRALGGGDAVYRANRTPRAGFSVRCLKD